MAGGAGLVVTDTNRKQAFRWDTLTANYGATETPDSDPAKTDLSDSPIDLFSGAPSDARATAAYIGAADVTASSTATRSPTPQRTGPTTRSTTTRTRAWRTGTFVANPSGQWWQVRFTEPVTTGTVTLVQPVNGDVSRSITRATLTFDGGSPVTVDLGPSSRTSGGQVISFPQRAFHTLRITVDATSDDTAPPAAAAAVGLAEVEIPGQKVVEVVQMPQDLLRLAGPASQANRLTLVMTRQRVSPYPPRLGPRDHDLAGLHPPERPHLHHQRAGPASRPWSPTTRSTGWSGGPGSAGTGIVAFSKGRMPGDLDAGAARRGRRRPGHGLAAGLGSGGPTGGEWLQYDLPKPITFDHLNLQVVADGRHSVPTAITISTEQGSRSLALPPIADSRAPGATVTVPLNFPALSGDQVRLTVTGVRPEYTTNYYAEAPIALPLGIAEVGIPNVVIPPVPAKVPVACRSNLLAIDGHPVSVEITGSTRTALDNGDLSVKGCGPDANGIALAAGPHILQSVPGHDAANPKASQGWNLDQVVLELRARRGTCTGGALRPAPSDPAGTGPLGDGDPPGHGDPGDDSDRCHRTLRARARPERQRRLAGGRHPRPRRPGRCPAGRSRSLPAGRRLRQRLAGQRRPVGHAREGLHRRDDLDAPVRGLGGPGHLGPGRRLLPGPGRPAPPMAGRRGHPAPAPTRRHQGATGGPRPPSGRPGRDGPGPGPGGGDAPPGGPAVAGRRRSRRPGKGSGERCRPGPGPRQRPRRHRPGRR